MTTDRLDASTCRPAKRLGRQWALLTALALLLLATCAVRPTEPRSFNAPEDAVRALVDAARASDISALLAILGSDGQAILSSGDDVADRQRREKFIALYDEKHSLVRDEPNIATLVVGNIDWPFPIPLVHDAQFGWTWDTAAGKEEILNRRIGDNELSAIQVCQAIGDAQREFALQTTAPNGMHEYAQQFASDPGKHNGLYWPAAEGQPPSPLGDFAARAAAEGYARRKEGPTPYHGYYYRILSSQGPQAPDGALNYLVHGHMVLGFAVLAYPAEYGNSGIMTFLMGDDGVVYQKDLGDDTAKLAPAIQSFDPGPSWKKAQQPPMEPTTGAAKESACCTTSE